MILVEGMPVGSLFGFAWNLLGKFSSPYTCISLYSYIMIMIIIVSASFQFVGFLLTYLLHTSHAAKVTMTTYSMIQQHS